MKAEIKSSDAELKSYALKLLDELISVAPLPLPIDHYPESFMEANHEKLQEITSRAFNKDRK